MAFWRRLFDIWKSRILRKILDLHSIFSYSLTMKTIQELEIELAAAKKAEADKIAREKQAKAESFVGKYFKIKGEEKNRKGKVVGLYFSYYAIKKVSRFDSQSFDAEIIHCQHLNNKYSGKTIQIHSSEILIERLKDAVEVTKKEYNDVKNNFNAFILFSVTNIKPVESNTPANDLPFSFDLPHLSIKTEWLAIIGDRENCPFITTDDKFILTPNSKLWMRGKINSFRESLNRGPFTHFNSNDWNYVHRMNGIADEIEKEIV